MWKPYSLSIAKSDCADGDIS